MVRALIRWLGSFIAYWGCKNIIKHPADGGVFYDVQMRLVDFYNLDLLLLFVPTVEGDDDHDHCGPG